MVVGVGDVDVDAGSGEPAAGVDGVDTQLVVLLLVEVQRLRDRDEPDALKKELKAKNEQMNVAVGKYHARFTIGWYHSHTAHR